MGLHKKFRGTVVPMVTPFGSDLSVDTESNVRLIRWIVCAGAHPFLFGTTGESSSLSENQKEVALQSAVQEVAGRSMVYAGVSANCLEDSIRTAKKFADIGANAVVAHVPFYFPMDGYQAMNYFEKLAERSPLPLILYNMPATTRFSIPLEVVEKLSDHPNIGGIKDSERDEVRMIHLIHFCRERSDFSYLLGWTACSYMALTLGADGIVPSTGNIFPDWYVELAEAIERGEQEKAHKLQELTDEVTLLYQEKRQLNHSIPALKMILAEMGLCQPWVMPPLYRMGKAEEEEYRQEVSIRLKMMMERKRNEC